LFPQGIYQKKYPLSKNYENKKKGQLVAMPSFCRSGALWGAKLGGEREGERLFGAGRELQPRGFSERGSEEVRAILWERKLLRSE